MVKNNFKKFFTLHSSLFTFTAASRQSGQVLFEILLAVAILVGVAAVSVQLSQMSLQSADVAGDRTVATNLSREVVEATRAISGENWTNFYNITKGSQYHPEVQTNKWVLVSGSENVIINSETYARFLTVDNVSRNLSSGDIESVYNSANDDPSTQKVTIMIQKSGLADVTYSEYISRWRNASPVQTIWQASGQGDNPTSGDSTNFNNGYSSDDGNVDTTTTTGSLKLKTQ